MKKILLITALIPLAACAWWDGMTNSNTQAATPKAAAASAIPPKPLTAEQKAEGIDKLNEISGMLIDSNKLYGDAAKLAKDAAFKIELTRLADERGDQAKNFEAHVTDLGGTPVTSGGVGAPWQEGLMHLASLGQSDTKAAIGQVLKNEDGLLDKLDDTIKDTNLAPSTTAFLKGARVKIAADRDRVAELKAKVDAQTASK
jgi:uncharacterized protein (TIGR02284 family)